MFHGSIPALVTPFKNGAVDKDAFANLVERQIAGGSGALVPVGTTGETSTLSHEEHKDVVTLCVEVAKGRVPVIAGAGSNATAEAIELAAHAKKVGADAALIVCPYYNKPNQAGLEAHFKAINDAVQIPIIMYNVPGRTASDLQPATVARLAKLPNVIGIKDASAEIERVSQHARLTAGEQFVQICGNDHSTLPFLASGGAGCISVTANLAPDACAAVHAAFAAGDLAKARQLETELMELHLAMFAAPSPGPVKYAMSRLGLCTDEVRLPITKPDEEARARIDAAMAQAGIKV